MRNCFTLRTTWPRDSRWRCVLWHRFLSSLACPVINITCLCVICDSCWVNCSWTDTTSQSWHDTSVNQRTWSSWWTSWETRAPTFSLRLSMSSRYTLFFQINGAWKMSQSKLCFIWRMHYVPKPSKGHMIALCKEQIEICDPGPQNQS